MNRGYYDREQKILIVDGEPVYLKVISYILENYGYAYEGATNGIEALKKTKSFSPNLIFLDIMMPEMDASILTEPPEAIA